MPPTLDYETRLYEADHDYVAGLDEVGRGAWAGPLVAGAVILPKSLVIPGVDDSKRLTPDQREKLFLVITRQAIAWSVGVVDPEAIDEDGIVDANRVAMKKALRRLSRQPDHLLVDGFDFSLGIPSEAVIKGDQLVQSIAAASIVAKVVRDEVMRLAHKDYPEYGFADHKGYGTEHHHAMIQIHGLSPIHRASFAPMKDFTRIPIE